MAGFFEKLKKGLSKTSGALLAGIFAGGGINDAFYEELEEALIMADVGMATTQKLLDRLRDAVDESKIRDRAEARGKLAEILADSMRPADSFISQLPDKAVLLIVGVNGVGKTTSIGKIAYYYKERGYDTLMAAADTFRAAAAEQLTVWAQRADVQIIKHGEGADPAAVIFDAIASFKAKGKNLLICDTAGRLHNKKNLMSELEKMRRIIARELPEVRTEVLMVLDATTGQNAIAQAKAFGDAAGITGIILTKLDGTAKGGVALAVKEELGVPVRFAGVGEGIDDLQPFDPDEFAQALLG